MSDSMLVARLRDIMKNQVVVRGTVYPERGDFFVNLSVMTMYAEAFVEMECDYYISQPWEVSTTFHFATGEDVDNAIAKRLVHWSAQYRVLDPVYVCVSSLGSLRWTSNADWRFLMALSAACHHVGNKLRTHDDIPTHDRRPEMVLRRLLERMTALLTSQAVALAEAQKVIGHSS